MQTRSACTTTCACCLALCASLWLSTPVLAAPCESAKRLPQHDDPVEVMAEARLYAQDGRYEDARAMYEWILKRFPADRDVRAALARTDAWSGCLDRAKRRYTALLREEPNDVEVRAGLADVQLWSGELEAARATIDAGLKLDSKAAELWRRRSVVMSRSADRGAAIAAAERAEALAPSDPEIRAIRDRLFLGQARLALRLDRFPRGYPDIRTVDLQTLQSLGRVEVGANAQVVDRYGGSESRAIVDELTTGSAFYQAPGGVGLGLSLGAGTPARAIPRFVSKLWFVAQLGARLSASLAYSLWQYRDGMSAHIIAPTLGYALTDTIQLEARAWLSYLVLPRPGTSANIDSVYALSLRTAWRSMARLLLGCSYTYGPQLDKAPTSQEFLRLESHIVTAFSDFLLNRHWGLQVLVAIEERRSEHVPFLPIFATELASYVRW